MANFINLSWFVVNNKIIPVKGNYIKNDNILISSLTTRSKGSWKESKWAFPELSNLCVDTRSGFQLLLLVFDISNTP